MFNDFNTFSKMLNFTFNNSTAKNKFYEQNHFGEFSLVSWHTYRTRVRSIARGLQQLEIKEGDSVVILLDNSIWWDCTEKACLGLGLTVIGIDPSQSDKQIEKLISQTKPRLIFHQASTKRFDFLNMDGVLNRQFINSQWLIEICNKSENLDFIFPEINSETIATFVFSSGTTGEPKVIGYTHRQYLLAISCLETHFSFIDYDCRTISWLPPAQLFQRIANMVAFAQQAAIYFIENPQQVMLMLPKIKPQYMIGVPRIFDKVYDSVILRINSLPLFIANFLTWSIHHTYQIRHKKPGRPKISAPLDFMINIITNLIIFSPLRKKFGSSLELFISGSAPCRIEVLEFFSAAKMPIFEAYGLSENILPIAASSPSQFKIGSVGKVLSPNKVHLDSHGEILVSGPSISSRYYFSSSHSLLDSNKVYHTGDIGEIDEEGFVFLRGRKNDIFKTSTGKKIIPFPIERDLMEIEGVDYGIVFGERHPWLTAIINWPKNPTTKPDVQREHKLVKQIEHINKDRPLHERIRSVLVIEQPFVAGQELTLNLKIRKRYLFDECRPIFENIYNFTPKVKIHQRQMIQPNLWWIRCS